jgi:predicted nuclease of predicted toxin-antitoxin system
VRLLLDANLCPRGIAIRLRSAGHEVLALAEEPALEGLDDSAVLELAASDNRVLITRNSRDFAPLAREWAEAQRSHAGIILIWTRDHSQFRQIVEGIQRCLDQRAKQKDWHDIVVAF